MELLPLLSVVILVLAAALAIYAGFTDLREFRIPNELVAALGGLFLLHVVVSGRWVELPWHIGLSLFMLVFLLLFYARNWVGGGDVKMLSVAFLWVGVRCALPFAVLLLLFSVVHLIVAKLGWVPVRTTDGRARIAFAPSIAAALIASLALGCR